MTYVQKPKKGAVKREVLKGTGTGRVRVRGESFRQRTAQAGRKAHNNALNFVGRFGLSKLYGCSFFSRKLGLGINQNG